MCGISGILHRDSGNPVAKDQITRMNEQMPHRGPDADGVFVHNNIGLGHRRLKIIDLEGGVQPMFSSDNSITIVFNGEIYNFKEIRQDLEKKGHQFTTHSDTEVIINAYIEYGENCVEYLNGMFAIAIYDKNLNKLFITRDRIGEKPLYYYVDNHRFIFASEVKPILSVLDKKPGVYLPALDFYMSVGYSPGEDTMFDGIKKLKPGHSLSIVNNQINTYCYWDLQNTPTNNINFDDALAQFDELMMDSINLRLRSDVPLGAFLSGGLDSSVIVGLMSKLSDEPVKTFSVGYKNQPEANELGYAKIVADYFKTDHHEYILEPLDFFNSLDVLLDHTEEPIIESAAVALYQLSSLAKEHVTVILSGEGGDEILAGYPLHQIMPKIDRLHNVAKYMPKYLQDILTAALSGNEKYAKYWDWITHSLSDRYQSISNDVTLSIKQRMYQSADLLNSHQMTSDYYHELFNKMDIGTDLRKMTYSDIKSWLPDDLLIKADKMTMATSLELRVPFLDYRLIEYSTALPDNFRLNGKEGKYLLKKYAESILPHEIIYRKKKGFPVPIANWFRTNLYEHTCEILLDNSSLSRGYFKPGYVENVLKRHKNASEDLSRRIFSLLNLELWHRKYIDSV